MNLYILGRKPFLDLEFLPDLSSTWTFVQMVWKSIKLRDNRAKMVMRFKILFILLINGYI